MGYTIVQERKHMIDEQYRNFVLMNRSNHSYAINNPITSILSSNSWKNRGCFIIGGGESLKGFDFNQLKGELIIGINKAFQFCPHATINYAMDSDFYDALKSGRYDSISGEKLWDKWEKFNGWKVFLTPMGLKEFGKEVYLVRRSIQYSINIDDLNNGIFGGKNCYDEQTEVLTEQGFKLFKNLTSFDKVATLNITNNQVEYHLPTNYQCQEFKGKLVSIKGSRVNLLVTENHNLYVKEWTSSKEYKIISALKCYQEKHRWNFKKDFNYSNSELEYFILPSIKHELNFQTEPEIKIKMNDWLCFFGLFLSEGCVSKYLKNNYTVQICQKKRENLIKIEQAINNIGFKFFKNFNKRNNCYYYIISNKQLYEYLKCFGKAKNKYIPRWVFNCSNNQLQTLFNSLILGDGGYKRNGYFYYTSSLQLANDIYEIGLRLGYTPYLHKRQRKTTLPTSKKEYFEILYSVNFSKYSNTWVNHNNFSLVDYFGKIYCVTVPNHIIYVRREGRSCWSGNSGFGAIMLAIALGSREIYLLGYDLQAINQSHWHSGYPNRDLGEFNDKLMEYKNEIISASIDINKLGVKVFNLNKDSALKCFPFTDIETVLAKEKK